jgi:pimeloyl-ACP methyl ester carboxylesterase
LRQARARCGFVTVPLDYDNPSGRTIELAVSRVQHTTRKSQGVMLINPGGPGGSGLEFAVLGRLMPRRSGAGYDWIGFDPRGVGASRPALSCQPNYFHGDRPPYKPTNKAVLRSWLRRSESYAQSCAKYGDLLDHMKTEDNARDIDRIRQALGVEQINFYGYSYGSYLGQVYATMFPAHVRRMVLDSNVDPRQDSVEAGTNQTLAMQRVFEIYFRWVARHHETYRLGRSAAAVERLYLRQRRILGRQPAAKVLGPSEWDDAFLLAGYSEVYWPYLARGFAGWVHSQNPRPLIRAWRFTDTPGDDNLYAAFLATLCTDRPSPTDWRTVVKDSRRLYRQAPITTWSSTWFSAPCIYWPAEPGTPVTVEGNGTSILLVGQTLDGATPFQDSLAVRSIFPGSRLVAIRGGTTHGSTPDMSGRCANLRLAAYLKTGALPPRKPGRRADVTCPAPPKPKP